MNKKLIAIALVLLIAVSGVFAEITVDMPGPVTATLKATKGEFLYHGFTVNSVKYQSAVEVLDAFNTNPEFTYGYWTNAQGTFSFRMSVGNFIHQTPSNPAVKIAQVKVNGTVAAPVSGETYYELFNFTNAAILDNSSQTGEKTITIVPVATASVTTDHLSAPVGSGQNVADALAGSYTSEVSIYIIGS